MAAPKINKQMFGPTENSKEYLFSRNWNKFKNIISEWFKKGTQGNEYG